MDNKENEVLEEKAKAAAMDQDAELSEEELNKVSGGVKSGGAYHNNPNHKFNNNPNNNPNNNKFF